jgi:hypothetical protein
MNEEKRKVISDICPFYKEYGTCDQCNTELDIDDAPCYFECMANAIIGNGYTKTAWISVDERLPEDTIPTDYKRKTIKVLVAIKGKNGFTIRTQERFLDYTYRDDKRAAFWTWRFSAGNVTHWMPLPEPPNMKGATDESN